jgi:hypothetical protein
MLGRHVDEVAVQCVLNLTVGLFSGTEGRFRAALEQQARDLDVARRVESARAHHTLPFLPRDKLPDEG